ncbi:MAG: protein-L-isoaspartate(D-aspartate) O-methyltransferase [Rhodospirillales bacterium]
MTDGHLRQQRDEMVQVITAHAYVARAQIGKEMLDDRVLEVMARVPRHEFVPAELSAYAYIDRPLPIGYEKTISQPFIIALMTDLAEIRSTDAVLEVGTGLGYHTAVLAELAGKVYSVEIIEELAVQARKRLAPRGYANVEMRVGNGEHGWPERAPFDRIVVCAASELVPAALITQLKPGGRMVIPAGLADAQTLMVVERTLQGRVKTREVLPVRFAPMETAN